jgi:2-polyprenyl-3-methyl-5-hydroxy-6-metoxy-1,4-benzoquinol methylase
VHIESANNCRVLVFIVAYQAERHAAKVLDRVPPDLWDDDSVHFLLIDDASKDQTVSVAADWVRARGVKNITLLRNPVNQGYGGNQKLGYRIAVESGFDFVILLHGDGQYAPEMLPKFIETFRTTNADVVLGSRMSDVKSARQGGMPWYKVIGNRFLTTFQNRMTGRRLSEYHTGYRGYSTNFLKSVPFETNTNDFHFDTEILLQAFHVNAKFEEFSIPTHYGDEVCHVQGFKYARDVVRSTLQYKLHQLGMLCTLKYRNLAPQRYRDKTRALYSSHTMALEVVKKKKPQRLLDIGCGPGHVARECENAGVRVTGLDFHPPEDGTMTNFHMLDFDKQALPVDAFDYDMVLLLDVIEHLADPEQFLLDLRNTSKATEAVRNPPNVVISTPNVAFAAMRLNLLLGRFSYAERGILDITHKRLFTRSSLKRLLRDCGYTVEKIEGVPVPFEVVVGGSTGRMLGHVAAALVAVWPTMFAFQFLVTAKPWPGMKQVLLQGEKHGGKDSSVEAMLESLTT